MRDFEDDFNFDFEHGIGVNRICNFRHDVHKSLDFGSDEGRLNDKELQARIQSHQERVQRELVGIGKDEV